MQLRGVQHSSLLPCLWNAADAHRALGQHAESQALLQKAVRVSTLALGAHHLRTTKYAAALAGMWPARPKPESQP